MPAGKLVSASLNDAAYNVDYINQLQGDLLAAIAAAKGVIAYADSQAPAGNQQKDITVTGFPSNKTGQLLAIRFVNGNIHAQPRLNVPGVAIGYIRYQNNYPPTTSIPANHVALFVWGGNFWEYINPVLSSSGLSMSELASGDANNALVRSANDGALFVQESPFRFIDARDGRGYTAVKIGSQIWMAENLDYNTGGGNSQYYNSDANYSQKLYGRLYTWNEALTAAPPGWHLPTRAEWEQLRDYVASDGHNGIGSAGRILKAACDWPVNYAGVDSFGFAALPGGAYSSTSGSYTDLGSSGCWWTSTSENLVTMDGYSNMLTIGTWYGQGHKFSVRCVKD